MPASMSNRDSSMRKPADSGQEKVETENEMIRRSTFRFRVDAV